MSSTIEAEEREAQSAWSFIRLSNEVVEAIQEQIVGAVPDDWERIDDAHISILPGFDVPAAEMDAVQGLLKLLGPMQDEVNGEIAVNGVECFHELDDDEPSFVVKLDVDVDLTEVRKEQKAVIEDNGGSLNFEPVDPHVTLFKAGDGDDDHEPLSEAQRNELGDALDDVEVPETLTVEYPHVETY